jgi:gliding motility-associated-like protein
MRMPAAYHFDPIRSSSSVPEWLLSRQLFLWAFLLITISSHATHILGGTMYYEHVVGTQYRITLELYRDCGPNNSLNIPFDDPVMLAIYDGNGQFQFQQNIPFNGESLIPVTQADPCLTLPPYVCESVAYYSVLIDLPPNATGYHISYQRCCRTPGIVNLMIPEDQGFTCTVHIPAIALQVNSSPRFNLLPPVALCFGQHFELDMSASDTDGDQLVYALWTPFHGGSVNDPLPLAAPPPYQPVIWANGYGTAQPIDSDPQLVIDPATGIITLRPILIGSFAMGVIVSEYRNGQLIGVIHRDIHINVVPCETMVPASIAPQDELCTGLTINPFNQAGFGQLWSWDFGDLTTDADTSALEFPSWTFSEPGIYQITLITNRGYPCADTSSVLFDVRPPIHANFPGGAVYCPFEEVTLTGMGEFSPNASMVWDIEQVGVISGSPAVFSFPVEGEHVVKLYIEDEGCESEFESIITVLPPPQASLSCPVIACAGDALQFLSTSQGATPLTYAWDLGNGASSSAAAFTYAYPGPGTYTISLTVSTTTGCVAEDTMILPDHLLIHPKPQAGFALDRTEVNIFDPYIQVTDASVDATMWTYQLDGRTYYSPSFTHSFDAGGSYWIQQVVMNQYQCSDTLTRSVLVNGHIFHAPNAFTPGTDGINDGFGAVVLGALAYELVIHDRWGRELFRSQDPSAKWNGDGVPQGIYIYTARVVDHDRRPHEYRGHVTLLR